MIAFVTSQKEVRLAIKNQSYTAEQFFPIPKILAIKLGMLILRFLCIICWKFRTMLIQHSVNVQLAVQHSQSRVMQADWLTLGNDGYAILKTNMPNSIFL